MLRNSTARRTRGCLTALILCLPLGGLFAPVVLGNTLTWDFDQRFSGVPPAGAPPWLTAVFSDVGTSGVQLTLSANGLLGHESVNQWFFNLRPAFNPSDLVFNKVGASGAFKSPTVRTGADAFKPDHDGKYDILLDFAHSGDNSALFTGGDSITFNITGIAGLRISDFLFYNTPSAAHEPVLSAAYIQTQGEAIILDSFPAPSDPVSDVPQTAILLGMGLLALSITRRFHPFITRTQ